MTALAILIKASLLLSGVAAAQMLAARRTSAATRHLIWTLAIVGLLLLPLLAFVLPGWTAWTVAARQSSAVPVMFERSRIAPSAAHAVSTPPPVTAVDSTMRLTASMSWPEALLFVYLAGLLLLLARLAVERVMLQRLARRSRDVTDSEWTGLLLECSRCLDIRRSIRLLRSVDQTMPMAFGMWRAAILVPAIADTWPEDRRRAVLLHELAHVARYDCVTQMLAAISCAVYWIHPGAWWIARRLRVERELACDDCVISAGADARDYAGHLLEVAYTLRTSVAPALAVAMANSRQLEGRLLAVLDTARNRARPALRSRLAGLAVLGVVLVPMAAATTAVVSRSGGPVPAAPQAERENGQSAADSRTSAPLVAANVPGTWEIRPARANGMVELQLREGDGGYGSTVAVDQLPGLTLAQLQGAGPVQFSIRRDAGTFTFDGVVRNGIGAGTFAFAPDETFAALLATRGLGNATAAEQRLLAREDIGLAFLDELEAQEYARPDLALLIRAVQHGVSQSYLSGMGELGYRLGRIEALIEQRDHGVDPEFVRGLQAQGVPRLSATDLIRARDHGVDPDYANGIRIEGYRPLDLDTLVRLRGHGIDAEYITSLATLGYESLDLEQLVTLRGHGVDAEYVSELGALGYRSLTLDQLMELRKHGVDAEYISELAALGHRSLTLEELINLRNHGVDADYISALAALGYGSLDLEQLLNLRNHGVDADYIRGLQQLGHGRVNTDDLIDLRNHGVEPDRVRAANVRAGIRLVIDRLKELASGGWR
jgi:beta-lactamase regulating signal transducer with metallopeptidase domain